MALLVPPIRNTRGWRRNKIIEMPEEDFHLAILSQPEVWFQSIREGPGSGHRFGSIQDSVLVEALGMNEIVL